MAATLDQLLPVAADRTKRQAMVDAHFPPNPPAGFEGNWRGTADTTGFTTITCASADALATEMNNAGPADRLVLECAWNGITTSGQRMFGYISSQLVANGAVDWGYDRPAAEILVRPAAGFSPVYQSTYSNGVIDLVGFSKLTFENMEFEASSLVFNITATYPGLAMVAVKGCTFRNSTGSNTGVIRLGNVRVLHIENNDFIDCDAGFIGGANFVRSWNNRFRGLADNDVHGLRGALYGSWTTHAWVAGNIAWDMSGRKPTSGLHCDFLQTSHPNDSHVGYEVLAECNIFHLNRPSSSPGTQGFFGDDGSGYKGDWLVHNNLGMIGAYHGFSGWDPNDNEDKVFTKNMLLRQANPNANQDAYPWVQGARFATGTGSLTVRDNYAAAFNTGRVNGESFTNNVVVSPRVGATAGTRYQDVLTGNGSWGTDPNTGYLTFVSPDAGVADAATARTAIANFAKPLAGWESNGVGPVDPLQWPQNIDWSTLGSGGGGGGTNAPSLPGNALLLNVSVL